MADENTGFKSRHEKVAKQIIEMIDNGGASFIDAVLTYCEQTGITPEEISGIVKGDPKLLQGVTDEAISNNMLIGVVREDTLGDFFD